MSIFHNVIFRLKKKKKNYFNTNNYSDDIIMLFFCLNLETMIHLICESSYPYGSFLHPHFIPQMLCTQWLLNILKKFNGTWLIYHSFGPI